MSSHEPSDRSAPPPPREDARDPRTAALLAVEPLDEVTRARFVRSALAGSEGTVHEAEAATAPRRGARRVLAVAAAFVVVLAVGTAVLVPRAEESTPTAADAPAAEAAPEAGRTPASDLPGAVASSDVAPVPLSLLGDLGDVSTSSRLRAATRSLRNPRSADLTFVPRGCAFEAARAIGSPVAGGIGTVDGQPATVILVERPSGREAAVAIDDGSCAVGPSVTFR